jgi:hypothetical protein
MVALKEDEISRITTTAATTTLGRQAVVEVSSSPITNSAGQDALQITIVLTPGSSAAISGDRAMKTLVTIRDELQKRGEERFPIVEYVTKDELKQRDDFEP